MASFFQSSGKQILRFFLIVIIFVGFFSTQSSAQKLRIHLISVSSSFNTGENWEGHRWNVFVNGDKFGGTCFSKNNQGGVTYTVNQTRTFDIETTENGNEFKDFIIEFEGWEHEGWGFNPQCDYNSGKDRGHSEATRVYKFANILNKTSTWSSTITLSAAHGRNLKFRLYYEPAFSSPIIYTSQSPVCFNTDAVTISTSAITPSSYSYRVDWRYHVSGDVITTTIPNPAYCGPCGPDGPLDPPYQQSLAALPSPDEGNNPLCCNEPPFITTTENVWRTLVSNVSSSTYTIPPSKLAKMVSHGNGGLVKVHINYRIRFNGAASRYSTSKLLHVNPPPPNLTITGENPICKDGNGEIRINVNQFSDIRGVKVTWPTGGENYSEDYLANLSSKEINGNIAYYFIELPAGTHDITLKYVPVSGLPHTNTTCEKEEEFTLIDPIYTDLTAIATETHATSLEQTDGLITLSNITGGKTPSSRNFSISPPFGNWNNSTKTFNNLTGNTNYTITITEDCETGALDPIYIGPKIITGNATPIAVTCNGKATGKLKIDVSGYARKGNLQYKITGAATKKSPDKTITTHTFTGLIAGNYQAWVRDKGYGSFVEWQSIDTAEVTQPDLLVLSEKIGSPINVSCFGESTGQIEVQSSGGKGPHTYSISPNIGNQTGASFSNLPKGNYTITVTDDNNCSETLNVAIQEAQQLSASISPTNISCFGEANGIILVSSILKGTGNKVDISLLKQAGASFVLETSALGITPSDSYTFNFLSSGNYKIELINTGESSDCNLFTSNIITITQPAEIRFESVDFTNEICFDANNGTISPQMEGNNADFTFYTNKLNAGWVAYSPNSELTPGTYELKAKKDECEQIYPQSIIIDAPTQGLDFTWISNNYDGTYDLQCATATTTINLAPFGGWDGYQVALDGGQPSGNLSISNLLANTDYNINIIDSEGCSVKKTIRLKAPDPITSNFTVTSINCAGEATGTVLVSATGGLGDLGYKIDGGTETTNPLFENLLAGDHNIIISDGKCPTPFTINVPEQDPILINFNITHVDCYGADNGSITANVSGGVAPYSLEWNAGETNNTISDLAPGFYSLQITDALGCIANKQAEVAQPGKALAFTINQTNISCYGNNDGIIEFIAEGGTPPYQYSVSNGNSYSSNFIWTSLAPSTYLLGVIDANNCATTLQTEIAEPELLAIQLEQKIDVLCFGETGTIELKGLGGTLPYQFSIDGGTLEENDGFFDSILAGNHTFLINDANNCTATLALELTQPALPLQADFAVKRVTCKGQGDGIINTTISGGTSPYTFQWDNDPRATKNLESLIGGEYTLTVTDANQCTFIKTILVEEPEFTISASYVKTNISCNGLTDGSLAINATGGYGNFEYSFNGSNYATLNSFNNLASGTYSVEIKDEEGCVYNDLVEIIEPDILSGNLSVSANVLCYNDNTGSVSFFAIGGTPPYKYSINGGVSQAGYIFTNLISGSYQVVVTDENDCSFTSNTVFVNQPDALTGFINNVLNASCNQYNGKAKLNPTGGTPPYSYEWSHRQEGVLSNSQFPANLKSGIYDVKIMDTNLCEHILTQIINDDDGPVAQLISFTDATCFDGNNGSANVIATGGAGSYTFSWTNGEAGNEATQLARGEHFVEISDARGCTYTVSVNIGSPEALDLEVTQTTQPLCFNSCDGSVTVSASGGVGPYTYTWPTGVAANGATATGLCTGAYQVLITDTNGCEQQKEIIIEAPEPLAITFNTIIKPSCNGFSDGSLIASIKGGTGNYQLYWKDLPEQTSASLTNLTAGFYTATVQDTNGCSLSVQTELNEPEPLSINLGEDKIICANQEATLDAVITNGTYLWLKDGSEVSQNQLVETTGTGTYKLNLTNNIGCSATDEIFINQISNSLETAFLSATEIEVGDSLQLIDVSWEIPDDLTWDYGTEVNIIDDNLWSPIIQYDETGTYEIKLTAYLNGCVDSLTKIVTLKEASEESTSGRMAEIRGIKEVSVFPNPTDGKFSIHIELYAKEELAMSVYDITGGIIERQVFDEHIVFRNDFNLSGKKQGIYLVQILTPSEERIIRVFIK